jgi:hypothetical protein
MKTQRLSHTMTTKIQLLAVARHSPACCVTGAGGLDLVSDATFNKLQVAISTSSTTNLEKTETSTKRTPH